MSGRSFWPRARKEEIREGYGYIFVCLCFCFLSLSCVCVCLSFCLFLESLIFVWLVVFWPRARKEEIKKGYYYVLVFSLSSVFILSLCLTLPLSFSLFLSLTYSLYLFPLTLPPYNMCVCEDSSSVSLKSISDLLCMPVCFVSQTLPVRFQLNLGIMS